MKTLRIGSIIALWLTLIATSVLSQPLDPSLFDRYPLGDYTLPVEGEPTLSGSFGEIRPRHFHAGIDFRTNQEVGHPILAVNDGEIFRISVSPTGYGLCLYVRHGNGAVSLYGHLEGFMGSVALWVQAQQERQKSFQVDLFPAPGQFKVKRGEQIAWSGNSGSSAGPHLHFEMRTPGGKTAYNPYVSGIAYLDTIPPRFVKLYHYTLDTSNYERSLGKRKKVALEKRNGEMHVAGDTVVVSGVTGFSVETTDLVNRKSLSAGIVKLTYRVGGDTLYHLDIQQIPFDETLYIDALIDYSLRQHSGVRAALLFRLPGNRFSRSAARGRGLVEVNEGQTLPADITITDAAGLSTRLAFVLKGGARVADTARNRGVVMRWQEGGTRRVKDARVTVASEALYYDAFPVVQLVDSATKKHSVAVQAHNGSVPLFRPLTIAIRWPQLADTLRKKVYMTRRVALKRKPYQAWYYSALPSSWSGDSAIFQARYFDTYRLHVDTTPPVISASQAKRICNKDLSEQRTIRLKITDSQTPVGRIDTYVDGKWEVFNWDTKTSTLSTTLPERGEGEEKRERQFLLRVQDAVGNTTELRCPFTW